MRMIYLVDKEVASWWTSMISPLLIQTREFFPEQSVLFSIVDAPVRIFCDYLENINLWTGQNMGIKTALDCW